MKKKLIEVIFYGVFIFLCAWGLFWLGYVALIVSPILFGMLCLLAIALILLAWFYKKEENENDR